LPLSYQITPVIKSEKSGNRIGSGKFEGCSPLDFIEMNYKFTCPDCGEYSFLTNSHSYIPYIVSCQSCFSKGTFQIDGLDFTNERDNKNDLTSDKNSCIGKPLPKNGICKHFKNSFRWFKFPCCQRLFPCMICHDDNTDHPSQKAEIYICGFCGSLQKFSNKNVCKQCKGAVNGLDGDKRFWEGGKGCRNTEKMSKKEKRKHKAKN
jgi:uncharacterized CHY-type Zn-finger protein